MAATDFVIIYGVCVWFFKYGETRKAKASNANFVEPHYIRLGIAATFDHLGSLAFGSFLIALI